MKEGANHYCQTVIYIKSMYIPYKVVLANDNNIADNTIGNIIKMNLSSSVSLDISLMSFQTVVTIKPTYFKMTECISSDINLFLHHKHKLVFIWT